LISILSPINNEGPEFGDRLRALLTAVNRPDIEWILLDNQSINGCSHGLPRDVLIVRMETHQTPNALWRLGRQLAKGPIRLWVPNLADFTPTQLHALINSATTRVHQSTHQAEIRIPRTRFPKAASNPCLLPPRTHAQLERYHRIRTIGPLVVRLADRSIPTVIPLPIPTPADPKPAPPRPTASAARSQSDIRLSVIITAHNEGDEVKATVESVRAHTLVNHEIIVVDDASTDGSCNHLESLGARVIRHPERIGVAYSRHVGSQAALGNAFVYLDGHQRVEPGCLKRSGEVALEYNAITCPPCRPLHDRYPVGYGASLRLCPIRGYFAAETGVHRPRHEITWISALRSPGYIIPRSVYDRVHWIENLRGWGATDFCVAIKAFFTDINILHVNSGATRHLFRKEIPYDTTWQGVWRNHALIARVCFDQHTWEHYWLPQVFLTNLSVSALEELDSPAVLAEHQTFQRLKVRRDRDFWRGLLRIAAPSMLR
jgi:glycosyltransferase involved in cell wall biosynthesis